MPCLLTLDGRVPNHHGSPEARTHPKCTPKPSVVDFPRSCLACALKSSIFASERKTTTTRPRKKQIKRKRTNKLRHAANLARSCGTTATRKRNPYKKPWLLQKEEEIQPHPVRGNLGQGRSKIRQRKWYEILREDEWKREEAIVFGSYLVLGFPFFLLEKLVFSL